MESAGESKSRLSIGRGVLGLLDRGAQRAAEGVLNALHDLADDDASYEDASYEDASDDGADSEGSLGPRLAPRLPSSQAAALAPAQAAAPSEPSRATVAPAALAAAAPAAEDPPPASAEEAVRAAERRLLGEWSGLQFAVESTLAVELAGLEAELSVEREMRGALCAREAEWAGRCDQLRTEAAQREAEAARAADASAEARRAEVGALRARVGGLQAQLGERERMLDELNAQAGHGDVTTWRARAELSQGEAAQLRARLGRLEAEHVPRLQRARAERDEALEAARLLGAQLAEARGAALGAEGQLSRLSGALQLHVAQADELGAQLAAAEERLRGCVDRQVARSWVVTFLEHSSRRGGSARQKELLGLMAEWWAFSPEDKMRAGLAPSADALHTPHESLGERWSEFLHREAEAAGEGGGPDEPTRGAPG